MNVTKLLPTPYIVWVKWRPKQSLKITWVPGEWQGRIKWNDVFLMHCLSSLPLHLFSIHHPVSWAIFKHRSTSLAEYLWLHVQERPERHVTSIKYIHMATYQSAHLKDSFSLCPCQSPKRPSLPFKDSDWWRAFSPANDLNGKGNKARGIYQSLLLKSCSKVI